MSAVIIVNESAKGLRLVWARRATLIPEILALGGVYLAMQYFIGAGRLIDDLIALTTPGLFAYVVTYVTTMKVVAGILEERNTGTLEQIHLSPLSPGQLVVGRLGASFAEALTVGAVLSAALVIVLGIDYSLRWEALVPVVLMLAGVAGFVLLIAAISFTFAGIGALLHIIQSIVLLLNGALVPPELFPRWLEIIAKLIPSTLGVSITREMFLEGSTLGDLWATGDLRWLVIHTATLLVLGWVAYTRNVRRALRDGRLGPA